MRTIVAAGIAGVMIAVGGAQPAHGLPTSPALFGSADVAPLIAALLALAFLAQGGRRRLRM